MDKKQNPIYHAAYKKLTLALKTYSKSENEKMNGKRYFKQSPEKKKKAGVAMLTSDNIDIKPKMVKQDKEGHYNKGFNPSRKYNNYKYFYPISERLNT